MVDALDLAPDQRLRLYNEMLRIRCVELKIAELYAEQEMRCPVHLSVGQEAVAVGVCQAARTHDRVYSNHRSHAHYLAKGGNLKAMLAEIYGKADGCLGGRGGSMHLMDRSVGMEMSVPIVASSIPLAVGHALAMKQANEKGVVFAFIGDASVEEGVFHESANFASLHNLPVIFVCENNYYSIFTNLESRQPDRPIQELAACHRVRTLAGNGNNVEEVYFNALDAVQDARNGKGPTFLLFSTYRWLEHCGPNDDNHLGYRPRAEYERWKENCPLELYRQTLLGMNLLPEEVEQDMTDSIESEVDVAFEFAKAADLPAARDASAFVYAS